MLVFTVIENLVCSSFVFATRTTHRVRIAVDEGNYLSHEIMATSFYLIPITGDSGRRGPEKLVQGELLWLWHYILYPANSLFLCLLLSLDISKHHRFSTCGARRASTYTHPRKKTDKAWFAGTEEIITHLDIHHRDRYRPNTNFPSSIRGRGLSSRTQNFDSNTRSKRIQNEFSFCQKFKCKFHSSVNLMLLLLVASNRHETLRIFISDTRRSSLSRWPTLYRRSCKP